MRKCTLPILPALLAAVITGVILPGLAHAQTKTKRAADRKDREIELLELQIRQLESRVNTLEGLNQKVKVIDQKVDVQAQQLNVEAQKFDVEVQNENNQLKNKTSWPIVKASDEGFSFSSQPDPYNGNRPDYKINFGGIIQADGRFFTSGDDKNVSSTFYLNRVRPIITGTLGKYYDFNITPDFGQGKVTLQDAFTDITYFPDANFQAGKFKAPLDLERLQVDRDLEFSERSEIQNLVPNRDTGGEFRSESLWDGRVTYQAALMNGVPNNTAADPTTDIDNNDGKDFIGRIFVTPFKLTENEWIKGLGFGFAGSYGDERGSTTSTYKTYGANTWFSYNKGVTASGLRARLEPQAYYYVGPFGLMGEYAQDEHSLNLFATNGVPAPFTKLINRTDTFTDTGYFVQGSYLLTGENASFGWVKPHHPFDPSNGWWGGWELAARISNVATDTRQFQLGFANPSVAAKTATEWAAGVNWYLSANVKWQFDYANTFFDGGAGTTADPKDRPNESVFESQLQICF